MKYDDIIIGGGLSGLLCAISLAEKGRKCLIISQGQSTLNFSSGSFEFINTREGEDFAQAVSALPARHPYRKIGAERLPRLRASVASLMERAGFKMVGDNDRNHWRITPFGALKQTWLSLAEMTHFQKEELPKRILVVDIRGYMDFNASFIASSLCQMGLQATTCEVYVLETERLRDNASEFRSANIARVFNGYTVDRLACAVNEQAENADLILLPAVFGLEKEEPACRMLEKLSKPAAFIPTMSPSVPGIRMQRLLKQRFISLGGMFISADTVCGGEVADGRLVSVRTLNHGDTRFEADHFVFACGSFFSNGLKATRDKVYEPVLGLDVEYEGSHGEWFDPDVYAEQPYMSFGVRTDNQLRVSLNGQTLENAYAVGQLLSGASPIKSGCTGGVSAVSAVYVAELINQQ
ncbi:MAG: glycerol-3-phosphate dehydrogenase subunit GlpB [Bacteroidales bacterium]|nr:glycerol-3-phosphate dehydrogenase subunit GlpB [Bacteroidales bacterium]